VDVGQVRASSATVSSATFTSSRRSKPGCPWAGGGCLVRVTGDQFERSVLGLSMLDAEFTVVGPPALGAHFAEVGARFTRAAAS
jgi:hypothetical protein